MSHTASSPNLNYIRKLYAPQDPLLAAIDAELERQKLAINVGPDEGKILQLLIKLKNIKTIVEIGTLAGYSAIWMARALPEDGHLYTLEKEAKNAQMARGYFAESDVGDKITLMEGDASMSLAQLSVKAPFDMVFIDADKPGYNSYLDWAETHVRNGGLIVADNTLLFNAVAQDTPPEGVATSTWQAMRRFNERLADKNKYFAMMLPTQEGLSVAIKLF